MLGIGKEVRKTEPKKKENVWEFVTLLKEKNKGKKRREREERFALFAPFKLEMSFDNENYLHALLILLFLFYFICVAHFPMHEFSFFNTYTQAQIGFQFSTFK